MNIEDAIRNFHILKEEIIKDGKVDEEEVKMLISFMEPYTRMYSKKFSRLRVLLHEAKTKGVDKDKSDEIIKSLEEAEDFLKFEVKVERILGYLTAALVLTTLFFLLVR